VKASQCEGAICADLAGQAMIVHVCTEFALL